MSTKPIKSALISVYYKDGLDRIVTKLHALGVEIISTGGTRDFISSLNIPVKTVEDITGYPDLFGGRVKTLHPALMGGILHRREISEDLNQAKQHHIPAIDLVIVDLYPFEETLEKTTNAAEIIEKIDIGGISLIRAAAKNFNDVVIVPSRAFYSEFFNILDEGKGETTYEQRKLFAAYAFQMSSYYDSCIFNYFNSTEQIPVFRESIDIHNILRYGENPHQRGIFFGNTDKLYHQHHGKEISYNNLQDMEAAWELVSEFQDPAFVIVKHGNACGVAVREQIPEAWNTALSCDPLSAFGGVIATNGFIDELTAGKLNEIFFEVIMAKGFSEGALDILKTKKNRMILEMKSFETPERIFKSCFNGVLVQDKDNGLMNPEEWETVTRRQVPNDMIPTMIFANQIVRQTKSNAIVLAGNRMLLGSGMGQTSRVDAVKLAISKAHAFEHQLKGAVLASDAFFPFSDGIAEAVTEGIEYIVQPGGSIRDNEVIEYCDEHNIAMVFTKKRHFKH
jgi:phosphoribosylaminoimidazolecarboxamide formyltransferase / IMP cyclohydrolase